MVHIHQAWRSTYISSIGQSGWHMLAPECFNSPQQTMLLEVSGRWVVEIYYIDLQLNTFTNPVTCPILTTRVRFKYCLD